MENEQENIIMNTEDITSKNWSDKKWLWVIKIIQ